MIQILPAFISISVVHIFSPIFILKTLDKFVSTCQSISYMDVPYTNSVLPIVKSNKYGSLIFNFHPYADFGSLG